MQGWLSQLWLKRRRYYLGEWHFHPDGEPYPSSVDFDQMKDISTSDQYNCSEPILVIIGGDPPNELTVRVFVFPCRKHTVELLNVDEG